MQDAPALSRIADQPHMLKWMPDWNSTHADIRVFDPLPLPQYETATKAAARVLFAVCFSEILIDIAGIDNKEEVNSEIEIAYFIAQEHTGKGYAAEPSLPLGA